MSVQSVQDNGSVKGSLDLGDQITIQRNHGQTTTITVESYLSATTDQYDGNLSPNDRLANVLKKANRLEVSTVLVDFLNNKIRSWNASHPTAVAAIGDSQATRCSEGTTFVVASGFVTDNFCIDNEATYKIRDQYPTWQEAKDFCEAAGKFLLSYEQEKLGAKSISPKVVRNSRRWEWVSKSNGNDNQGQIGGFFGDGYYRRNYDECLYHLYPNGRNDDVAFRCGGSLSP
ncbi:MAG: hypothetical protein HYY44_03275 [Deltaproteobacteria bacterium]|nr:hypothetical protein [Deltaproteobacteria bacterium]MBI4373932.1 hypothetical protein [Deltaproteobacteria bacterium]